MIQMDTLGAGRRHDRGIRNRGAVVAANRTGHAGGDGDDHQLMVNSLEAGNHDGDQDTEGTPGRAGGKSQEHRNQEDDGRQEVHQVAGRAFHQGRHIFGGAQAVGHCL